ncbi:MAG: hypothetical protein QOF61_1472 [Acidobacteriota bacterium]|jgi:hypothetical protein|nr:hypothetical protein [Acidobacteriota bacterium]
MHKTFRWRWGALAAALLASVALIPQAHLRYTRGREWQGAYAYFYSDEPAYAAYLSALIEGRPRRSDPYTGVDDQRGAPLAESLFSIQFLPAYLLSIPARALGLSARTVFILLMPLTAIGCSLAVYWLVASITRDERAAVASVFVVLCLGILVSGQGFIVNVLGGFSGYVFLPFLRRYVPGVPLVFFFLFCGTLWRSLACETMRARYLFSLATGALFAALVYSYFYHWTAAAALAACCGLAWLVARPLGWRAAATSLAVFAAVAAASLVPYFYLVSHRASATDEMQALTHTRAPDLWRGVELTAFVALALLAYGARRGQINWRERAPLFTASLALSVLVVFNQQIITGLSLQPMHYEQYVGNYVALIALALACVLLWQGRARHNNGQHATNDDEGAARVDEGAARVDEVDAQVEAVAARRLVPHRLWMPVALIALLWGAGEALETTLSFARQNVRHDEWIAVTRRLDELARSVQRQPSERFPVVFNPDDFRVDHVPANTSCAVVWAPHMFAFASLTRAESRERVFQFLHFAAVAPADFAASGRDQGFIQFSIFGWERANPRLAVEFRPVTPEEIATEQRGYADYVSALEHSDRPPQPIINFVVVSDDQPFSLANLERFYTLTPVERVGAHTIYRATPRQL